RDLPHPVVAAVGDEHVACAVHHDVARPAEVSAPGRAAVAAVSGAARAGEPRDAQVGSYPEELAVQYLGEVQSTARIDGDPSYDEEAGLQGRSALAVAGRARDDGAGARSSAQGPVRSELADHERRADVEVARGIERQPGGAAQDEVGCPAGLV